MSGVQKIVHNCATTATRISGAHIPCELLSTSLSLLDCTDQSFGADRPLFGPPDSLLLPG